MEYRHLGKSGLQVSELSFGSWLTFGSNLDLQGVRESLHYAVDQGINFFDNAEIYGNGASEMLMGEVLREFQREDLVISTKIFCSGRGKGPNQTGLSWKRILEGTKNSLRRLQLEYVDLLFCHRPDPNTPIEETVRAMDVVVRSGLAFYWGTSEWSARDIEEAHHIAREIHAIPPTMEQPEYNLFHRERVEKEYVPLSERYGMGLTTWSPLNSGILSGKYNEQIPSGSRLALHPELSSELTAQKIEKVKKLSMVCKDLNCSLAQLAIAWCLKNSHVSSVILGATNREQLRMNIAAANVKHQLIKEVMEEIHLIMNS
jgi:voltage-dependent potassium channel beta subunit